MLFHVTLFLSLLLMNLLLENLASRSLQCLKTYNKRLSVDMFSVIKCTARLSFAPIAKYPLIQSLNSHRHKQYISRSITNGHESKSKNDLELEKLKEQMKSSKRIVRWGAIARSQEFKRGLTKYLVVLYILFLAYGFKVISRLREKEKELESLLKKKDNGSINEYETLRIKELKNTLRTRDEQKLKIYRKFKENLPELESFDGIVLGEECEDMINSNVLEAHDTAKFFDAKAEEYDSGINIEEMVIMMGRKRKWVTRQCHGDVLEVACGTGRNIKYMDVKKMRSITFLDASEKMVDITNKKFRDSFPHFKNAAFVVGKTEDLLKLASKSTNKKLDEDDVVKYDTIIQTFGLCSYRDPVSSLKNFAKLLKPDGRIILLEHGRGSYDFINNILDKSAKKRLETWGCRWNLDIGEIIDDSGLEIVQEKRYHMGTTWCIVAKHKDDIKKKG